MRHRFARFIIYAAARPAMAEAATAATACGVWVLMAARRKQSGNNSNSNSKSKSKSNCKSHASKYSAVAVYSGKQAKQLRQERQQTVCAVLWQLQKGRRLLRPHWHPAAAAAAAESRQTCNAQRATCHMQLAMAAVVA